MRYPLSHVSKFISPFDQWWQTNQWPQVNFTPWTYNRELKLKIYLDLMQSELMICAAAIVALTSYHVFIGLWHEKYCQLT